MGLAAASPQRRKFWRQYRAAHSGGGALAILLGRCAPVDGSIHRGSSGPAGRARPLGLRLSPSIGAEPIGTLLARCAGPGPPRYCTDRGQQGQRLPWLLTCCCCQWLRPFGRSGWRGLFERIDTQHKKLSRISLQNDQACNATISARAAAPPA